ncbi:MAG: tetratricopeptide repeat protein [Deltaproteobacteria bacterium]|nr:tetratricopeptide repeat protein [Deltaproteobacteria bacterium]
MTKAPITWALALLLLSLSGCSTLRDFNPSYDNFNEGVSLFNQGQFEAAIPYFERATREDPDFAEAYFYLGRSFVSLSRWRSAIHPLRTAFRLAPQESQEEIINLLIDVTFAAALNDFHLGDRLGSRPDQLPGSVPDRFDNPL